VSGPGYDALVAAHVLSAVVGFGAIGVTGAFAAACRTADNPRSSAALVRYFRPGTNWAARALLLTPVLGLIVLFAGDRSASGEPWPWIGLGLWTVAAGLATGSCWPAERRIQSFMAGPPRPLAEETDVPVAEIDSLRRSCRRVERSAATISLLFVAAVFVMLVQPG
jgi:hypothetical protein